MLLPYQDFSSILPDPSIGVVLFSFNMHRSSPAWSFMSTDSLQ